MSSIYMRWLMFSCGLFLFLLLSLLLSLGSFSTPSLAGVSHWILSNSKSPQVTRILPRILVDLNDALVWMVFSRTLIYKSSSPCTNPLVTVPGAPITIDITITFIFHSFFNSQARSKYLSFFSISFSFTLWSIGIVKSTIRHVLFFLLVITRSGRLAEIRWSVCISKS